MKKKRNLIKDDVPELWRQRYRAGVCPVCSKEKSQFEKGRRVYCSLKCVDEYSKKYTSWSVIRDKILQRDHYTCRVCGLNPDKSREIGLEKTKELNKDWMVKNQEVINYYRDKALIELENHFKESYDKIMDDAWIIDREIPYDEKPQMYVSHFTVEVDHIKAVGFGGEMWDEKNLQVLCGNCHKHKTRRDRLKIRLLKEKLSEKDLS